jgi:hypothetical protein
MRRYIATIPPSGEAPSPIEQIMSGASEIAVTSVISANVGLAARHSHRVIPSTDRDDPTIIFNLLRKGGFVATRHGQYDLRIDDRVLD